MTLLVTLVFAAVLLSPVFVLYNTTRKSVRERESNLMRRLGNSPDRPTAGGPAWSLAYPGRQAVRRLVERLAAAPLIGPYFAQTLRPASLPALLTVPVLFIGSAVALTRWLRYHHAFLVGIGSAALPLVYLHVLRRRWLALLSEQLPYLVDQLKAALESGHTMLRALQIAARNLPDPVASELRLIVEQVQLGMTVPLALEAMYQRAPVEELGFLVAAVRIQSDIGSSIAEVFQHVAEGMRNRQRAEQQLSAITAQSRMSAVIVSLLPFIVLAALSFINPAYSAPLFYSPAGIFMLKTAIVLDLIAFFVMRRIARVNY